MVSGSSFRALCALLVAASVCSPVLSLPTTSPSAPRVPALRRDILTDYIDNLIYLDSNKTYIYAAVSINNQSYATTLDNHWSGLVVYGDKYNGSSASTHSITIQEVSVTVEDGREKINVFEEDVDLEYFHAPQWPSSIPHINLQGIGWGWWGLDINNPMSPIYSYFAAKWPSDYSKWYYDILIWYDWAETNTDNSPVDYAGLIVPGEAVDWTKVLQITQAEADQYGLPHLSDINNQPYIWLLGDGTFYLDSSFSANGQQTTINSQVPKATSGKVVADIYFTKRWSTFPDEIVNAIYANVSGAKYYPESTYGYYQIPCDTKLSFEFAIDGHNYTVPSEALVAPNPWGEQCVGSVMTKGQAVAAVPEWDIIIGFELLSGFYYRAGINYESDKPYYKLLPIPTPSWDGYSKIGGTHNTQSGSGDVPNNSWSTASSTTWTIDTSAGKTTYSSDTNKPTTAYNSVVATNTFTDATATWTTTETYTPTSRSGYNADHNANTQYDSNTTPYDANIASPTESRGNTAATQVAGNLAASDDDVDNDKYIRMWKHKSETYEIVIVVLSSILGLGLIAAIVACVVSCRKRARRPSAYNSIHDAESSGTNAPLYDAEGGKSRYADPYQDKE